MEDIILVGFGGHGKSVADTIERGNQYKIYGYTDIKDHNNQYHYLGTDEVLPAMFAKGINNACICIGYLGKGNLREEISYCLKNIGFDLPVIIDPTAIVSKTASLGEGSFIGKRAVVNADASVGKYCIINTGAIIEHECKVGDFSHVAVGAVLCGQVTVGEAVLIGANATVIQCRVIESRRIIPAGMVVR